MGCHNIRDTNYKYHAVHNLAAEGVYHFIYKKDILSQMKSYLDNNVQPLHQTDVMRKEELIYVYNWLTEITAKYSEEMESFHFVHTYNTNGVIPNCTINVSELQQSVLERPFIPTKV